MQSLAGIRKWGTSRAVVITRRVQEQLTWRLQEVVHVVVEDDAIVLRPVRFVFGKDARDAPTERNPSG